MIETAVRQLPCTREQGFDLAADVERYPDFLRGWLSVRIARREANICYVDQVLGMGPLRVQFSSKAVLLRPERIDVTSSDAPFRRFSLSWLIDAGLSAGCRVSIVADLQLRSRFLQAVVDRVLPASVVDIMAAFEARVRALYAVGGEPLDRQAPHH